MKIVLDTNCLLPALPKNSVCRWLWNAFLEGKYDLFYTTEILHEYEELMSRYYSPAAINLTMETLLNSFNAYQIIPYYKWNLIHADLDDNKFVDCALNAGADFIVTNDKHFNVLKKISFPPIKVINMEDFKKILWQNNYYNPKP